MSDHLEAIAALVVVWAAAVLLALATATVLAAMGGWVVMIASGHLHRYVPAVPAFGYLAAASSTWALGALGSMLGVRPTAH